ncbi:uncharacterized protein LOC134277697 [Saccostrea cucullata]|uniref:uncharacterized protein LOC134277697 n=1 Tax=Saccostrea cuccullata TaxID=36930 RepID=UPI002ED0369B
MCIGSLESRPMPALDLERVSECRHWPTAHQFINAGIGRLYISQSNVGIGQLRSQPMQALADCTTVSECRHWLQCTVVIRSNLRLVLIHSRLMIRLNPPTHLRVPPSLVRNQTIYLVVTLLHQNPLLGLLWDPSHQPQLCPPPNRRNSLPQDPPLPKTDQPPAPVNSLGDLTVIHLQVMTLSPAPQEVMLLPQMMLLPTLQILVQASLMIKEPGVEKSKVTT